jgi:hypothetical protein
MQRKRKKGEWCEKERKGSEGIIKRRNELKCGLTYSNREYNTRKGKQKIVECFEPFSSALR